MATQWTSAQKLAIDSRDGTLLVSAAAGSGKTAVLVQRMIDRITDPDHPGSIDRILMVTFSRKAAGEMRTRVHKALSDLLLQDPGNTRLKKQLLFLQQAKISTVHSFCAELVREFSYKLPGTNDFRIGDENELALLRADAMDQLLEENYAESSEDFLRFADLFSTDRSDSLMEKVIFQVNDFVSSHPFPEVWMEEMIDMYNPHVPAGETVWGQKAMQQAVDMAAFYRDSIPLWISLLQEEPDVWNAYAEPLLSLQDQLKRMPQQVGNAQWREFWEQAGQCLLGRPKVFRGKLAEKYPTDHPLRVMMKDLFDEMKADFQKIAASNLEKESEDAYCVPEEQIKREISGSARIVREIFRLVTRYRVLFANRKQEQKLADYDDLEHWALQVLCEKGEDGSFRRTQAAQMVSSRFDEVMVDEYQDTNETQDTIFRAVSREEKNLFFVGDVKQSIYSFRQAMPQIFIRYRKTFQTVQQAPAVYPGCVVLDRNFRSRQTVTDFSNFVFSQIMSESVGDVAYEGQEKLVCGSTLYAPAQGYEPECWLIDRSLDPENKEADAVLEGRLIAHRIRQMIDQGFQVTDKAGPRKAREEDFCILLRTVQSMAPLYAQELNRAGLHACASDESSFFKTPEISLALSLLRVIDNPTREIPLLSVMMSALYGFSSDEVARIRLLQPFGSLYTAVVKSVETDERARKLLQDLQTYRAAAAVMRADQFLLYLFRCTRLLPLMQALPEGETRRDHLYQLLDFAGHYEQGTRTGLSGFLRYVEKLEKGSGPLLETSGGASEKGVALMSIHKSKGLEFPVVILAGCGYRFHSEAQSVVLDPQMGVGLAPEKGASFVRDMVLLKKTQDQYSEEMRILYVALTRAKEKLLLVMTADQAENALRKAYSHGGTGQKIPPYALRKARSVEEWLLSCLLRHPDAAAWRDKFHLEGGFVCTEDATPVAFHLVAPLSQKEKAQDDTRMPAFVPREQQVADMVEKIRFVYDSRELTRLEAKVTASEIAQRENEEAEILLVKPRFLSSGKASGADRGNAMHQFMQFADYHAAALHPVQEGERLQKEGFLDEKSFALLDWEAIRGFFASSLGQRSLKADNLWREYRFAARIEAGYIHPELQSEEARHSPILLQGAVDCLFEEPDGLILIDYKTDRGVTPDQLWQRYRSQVNLYRMALEKIFQKKVKETYLYSFFLGRPVCEEKVEKPLDFPSVDAYNT